MSSYMDEFRPCHFRRLKDGKNSDHTSQQFHQLARLCFSGNLSKKERSDDAGQFVGKWAGSARAGMREEQSDDRSPATAPSINKCQQGKRPPEGGPGLTDS